ncbi:hypothetical protein DSCW_05410 [Desulfosarcina widdelii]|uniref:Uncharacterized protein n=1 Tax=Desulfosarcina widdelii TaxID=947919 RepID=A0A5K7Z3S0_9BACT|nr:hypothetical protein [Desulfosarcina widdelii]BBO73124.1 hypothetical protein DSCW_05410 [Desulfosarcina widdelii]
MSKRRKKDSKETKKLKFEIHDDFDAEVNEGVASSQLEIFRISQDEKPGVIFTRQHQIVQVHYCREPEIKGYVICNIEEGSEDCVLCQIGRQRQKKLLFPIVSLETEDIEVLSVSNSLRPNALLPQIQNVLESEKKCATFFSHEDYKYTLSTQSLKKDHRRRVVSVIKSFDKAWKAGEVDLSSVYQRISNLALANCTEIKKMLDLKGIDPFSDDD